MKDGHTFTVHVLDPKLPGEEEEDIDEEIMKESASTDEAKEKADTEKAEKEGKGVTFNSPYN